MTNLPSDLPNAARIKLESEKKQIQTRIRELSVQDPFSDPDRINDNASSDGEASEESSHDRFAAMIEELEIRVTEIDQALERIATGTYGLCMNCRTVISQDRLEVLPTASLCVKCEKLKSETHP